MTVGVQSHIPKNQRRLGFTIVELLIVVVVIAILAAITVVAYNGIMQRAQQSAQSSALTQATQKIKAYAVQNADQYPSTLGAIQIADSVDTVYGYEVDNSVSPAYFCVSVKVADVPEQFISSTNDTPAGGSCEGLVGWWPLNGELNDFARYRYTTTVSGAAPTSTAGRGSGSGGYLFGSGSLVAAGFDHGVMRPTAQNGQWTMSVWVRAASTSQVGESIIIGRQGCHGGLYTYGSPSMYQLAIKSGDSSNCWTGAQAASSPVIDTEWRHLAGVYDSGAMSLYYDGVLSGTATFATGMNNYGTDLVIGGRPGRYYNGALDDARVYDRALSATEVLDIYTTGAY